MIKTSEVIDQGELRRRARRIKLVLTDCDGVLTDTGVYYSHTGEEMKRFSIRDGMGVEMLREAGIETAIITRENTQIVQTRSEKLRMPYLFMGVVDKAQFLTEILARTHLGIDQLGYIGDDVNDLDIMRLIAASGLTAVPNDAMHIVTAEAHFHTPANGGHGAFRDFADWILHFLD